MDTTTLMSSVMSIVLKLCAYTMILAGLVLIVKAILNLLRSVFGPPTPARRPDPRQWSASPPPTHRHVCPPTQRHASGGRRAPLPLTRSGDQSSSRNLQKDRSLR